MTSQFLTTTSTEGLRPLGNSGQRSFELVTRTLEHAGRQDEARLFAEPQQTTHGDGADWYTDLPGRVVPLASADEAQRQAGLAQLAALLDGVAEEATALSSASESDRQRLGEALANACRYPGEDSVFLVVPETLGAVPRPVIINWAWELETRAVGTEAPLSARVAAPRSGPASPMPTPRPPRSGPPLPPAAPTPPEPTGGGGWLLWLVVAGLTVAVLYLLLQACGLRGLPFADFCPVAAVDESQTDDDLDRERAVLENRIARAERELARLDEACVPSPLSPPEPEPAPQPEVPPEVSDHEVERRLDREDAGEGDLEIALAWDNSSDLDLHLTCPGGQTIDFDNTEARQCGGRLDVDTNARNMIVNDPVEHIYFTNPPAGRYIVKVHLFRNRTDNKPHPFTVVIKTGGTTETLSGVVRPAKRVWRHSFEYTP